MSCFTTEDEAQLQSMLRQLLQSVKEKITGAPSVECAEEILLHLEETDENFHNYEFVKYLRKCINSTVGSVIEEETERCLSAQSQDEVSGYDMLVQHVTKKTRESKEYREMMHALKNVMMVVVESLINKFEEDRMHNKELDIKTKKEHRIGNYTDNCSDSDSSFNRSYTFLSQEQLQLLVERLDPIQPMEVRQEALQTLCFAPPSDILNSETWPDLRKHLTVSLSDPNTEKILRFYAKTFSSSPFNMTRDVYTSLARHLESYFLSGEYSLRISAGLDVSNPDIDHLLKKVRLLNEYQKEAPSSWIRHPEKYMEEVVDSTFSFLSVNHEPNHPSSPDFLSPVYFLALLDIKAVWFRKWTHAYYSRAVVLRLLENKYKSLVSISQVLFFFFSIAKGDEQNFYYTGQELQYVYFVHSLCLLGRLLVYKQGQNLFPVELTNKKDRVSVTDLLVLFTQLIYYSPSYPKTALAGHTDNYSPASLVMEILQIFCDQTGCAAECLYTDAVIDALLYPVQSVLSGTEVYLNCLETTLIDVADILARIAAVDDGLSFFLHGENEKTAKEDSPTAVHVIVQFTKKLLHDDISLLSGSELLPVVKGAFIFVCRQMYRTCEGLQMLIPYGLHESMGEAWKKMSLLSERVPTPVTGVDPASSLSLESKNSLLWEETLLDALLNFSATPKGLFLLHSTGAMNDCVNFMCSSLSKKLQVKFGNKVIITQMATTPSGAVALQSSGFIKALVTELWALLECGKDDLRVTRPQSAPIDPIDQSCQKSFLSLINLLTYPAVFELLSKQDTPNKPVYSFREVPTDIIDIIDRLIILNSEAKIRSLFSYEQSHIFGLRFLNVLCCELNTLLLLESQYKVSQVLLTAQEENVIETSEGPGDFIIDGLSVERNHVLVRINLIGGPRERILPLRVLDKYSVKIVFIVILYYIFSFVLAMDAGVKNESLSSVQQLGVEMTVRYGKYLNLLKEHAENGLCFVLMNCKKILKQEQRTVVSSLCCLQEHYPGYDWFASSIFLIMSGDGEKTLMFLKQFSRLLVSAFLWLPRLHISMHLPATTVESGIHPVYFCSTHYIEMLLKAKLPLVFAAFQRSGFTPSQICLQWITQCFWNYMDWREICHYIATCILLGPDYQIYVCISVFRHLQQDILKHTEAQDLQVFLKEEPLHGFRVSDYLEYMESLEAIYRPMLLEDMRNIRVQNA
uniref:Protein broad-minded n=1 Tax=Amazona collaria TaxID=241587 RepID=A0A8B9IVJ6_9PSIT